MADGFLGNKASFMLDFVVCALVLIVPVLIYSIYLIKVRRNYVWHRNLQLILGVTLLVAVGAFEVDLQIIHDGWESIVAKRTVALSPEAFQTVRNVLHIHLIFAISTPFLWAATIAFALKRFPSPPAPSEHSSLHKKLAWLSAIDLTLTSVTGLTFYYMAFVA